jgi:hypothetical protein
MKRIASLVAISLIVTPATAGLLSGASLLKVAGIVLKGKAVLNQGQAKCGTSLALQPQENLLVTAATAAVQKLLPATQFLALDGSASAAAATASQNPTFCQQTAAKKPGILGSIGDAAKKLGVGGGGLGGILGGSSGTTTSPPSTGATAGSILGGILGGGTATPPK